MLGVFVASQAVAESAYMPMGVVDPPATDQLIVKLKSQRDVLQVPPEITDRLSANAGQRLVYKRAMSGGAHVFRLSQRMDSAGLQQVIQRLQAVDADIELVEPDYRQQAMLVPNDTYYTQQWQYFDPVGGLNMPAAWNLTTGSSSVVVAVVDTGYRPHADLAANVLAGYDFIADSLVGNDGDGRDADAMDPGDWVTSAENSGGYFQGCGVSNSSWHGTHVSGTIAAVSNNGAGVAGVAWQTKILPVRVLGKCGGYTSDIVDGVRWAAGLAVAGVPTNTHPAKVISLSLGGHYSCSTTEQTAYAEVAAAGATVVVAAGNSNANASGYSPAGCNNVITVGANSQLGDRAYYSNFGATVEITAPGGDYYIDSMIWSTLNAGTTVPGADAYAAYQGTSMATPHVSGVVALMLAANPALTPAQVLSKIQSSARAFPAGTTCSSLPICGSGIVDAAAAINAVLPPDTTPNPFSFTPQTGVALNTLITSNAITVGGINAATPISITGCTSSQCAFNINNSATWKPYGSSSTVVNGNTVKVRQNSSSSQSATTSLILGIGGVSGSFSVTTGAMGVLQFSSPVYSVGEAGGTVTLTVNRTGGSSGVASVHYATANGTAASYTDYTAKNGTLNWGAGDGSAKTITVPIINNLVVEGAETFTVHLSSATGAPLGATSTATVTITDDDNSLQFSAAAVTVNESAGTLTLNVTRTGNISAAASVGYSTSGLIAKSGVDFTPVSGTLNWAAGVGGAKSIVVPIINDNLAEPNETFFVTLANPVGANLGANKKIAVTIAAGQ
jgi:serine protease